MGQDFRASQLEETPKPNITGPRGPKLLVTRMETMALTPTITTQSAIKPAASSTASHRAATSRDTLHAHPSLASTPQVTGSQ
jgi:hypothetical protein